MFHLTHKQLLELKFWCGPDSEISAEANRCPKYLKAFGLWQKRTDGDVLEIGTGPLWGMLPYMRGVGRQVGIDPMYPVYHAAGLLADRGGIHRIDEPFEAWETNDQFDYIITANALDHGEMGFYLVPKMWRLLKPGGWLYIHVHLRPPDLINLLHDHGLTETQLDQHLSYTNLELVRREVTPRDIDGGYECPTLVGVWRKPE